MQRDGRQLNHYVLTSITPSRNSDLCSLYSLYFVFGFVYPNKHPSWNIRRKMDRSGPVIAPFYYGLFGIFASLWRKNQILIKISKQNQSVAIRHTCVGPVVTQTPFSHKVPTWLWWTHRNHGVSSRGWRIMGIGFYSTSRPMIIIIL